MSHWGPADWSVVIEGAVCAFLLIVVFLCAFIDSVSETWRTIFEKDPPSDPQNRTPYKRPRD